MKYNILLFDADNTILDFDRAEEQALKLAFAESNLTYNDNVLAVYRRNNIKQWRLFEEGVIKDKSIVLSSRFEETFKELNLTAKSERTAELYEKFLHNGFYVVNNAEQVLQRLQSLNCKLYLVSNGVLSIQKSRMKGSGLDKYFIKSFVSEEVGFPKPRREYFDYCFAHIDNFERSKTIIIGDSLSSDIQGGINADIAACWYNPHHLINASSIVPAYEIDDLEKIFDIIK